MSSNLTPSAIYFERPWISSREVDVIENFDLIKKDIVHNWIVYILECSDNTYYTGITNNLDQRLHTHNTGKGAKYTSGRIPVELVYRKDNLTENQAKKTEFALKKLSRKEKEKIIRGEVAYEHC